MKVLLIQPPFTIFKTETRRCPMPLGLAYLAGSVKDRHEVHILDCLAEGYKTEEAIGNDFVRYGLSFSDIKRRIEKIRPDVVGVSCLFSAQVKNVLGVCSAAKEADERIVTVIGGVHASVLPEEMLRHKSIDFVAIGEGEDVLSNLLECIENNKGGLQAIPGLGLKHENGLIINRKNGYRRDLDNLPFPYWEIFPLERYFGINSPHGGSLKKIPFFPVMTSRGCPSQCVFCSVHNLWGREHRKRSAGNVLGELKHLADRFGAKEVMFEDDNLSLDRERAKAIFNGMIDKKLDISWSVPNGIAVQTLDDGMLELMKKSGCHSISIGVESGDEFMLKDIIRKPISLSVVKNVTNKARSLKMEVTTFFVVGLPGETRARLKNTFCFTENLAADNINFFFAIPVPGTRLLELCNEKGLIRGRLNYDTLKPDYPNFNTEDFSTDELKSIVLRERLKLYFLYSLRNPGKFICKVRDRLLDDPGYFLRFGMRQFK